MPMAAQQLQRIEQINFNAVQRGAYALQHDTGSGLAFYHGISARISTVSFTGGDLASVEAVITGLGLGRPPSLIVGSASSHPL